MLERVLPKMKDTPIVVLIEDAHRVLNLSPLQQAKSALIHLFYVISESGCGTVVCNSSGVPAIREKDSKTHSSAPVARRLTSSKR